ncbi:MAG: tRNA preQ1(34) S-adenosylmethionine ribosyltransferase-isomerase QueA, partial [Prevotellaceae bacterium]|nr:tRNA preQ1(34) S-adenosylmethionine ribosyltransferase-isomerase QueA [Prevotellaceae bacterium]
MKLSNFKFKLPESQVAIYPHSIERTVTNSAGETTTFTLKRPDEARLMVLHKKSQTIDMYKTDAKGKPILDADGNKQFILCKDIVD